MDSRLLAFALPLIIVALVSGCTIPGLEGILGQNTISYENDVIIIKELSVLPAQVKAGQPLTVYVDVQNVLPAATMVDGKPVEIKDINVELYDYCSDLFTPATGIAPIKISLSAQEIVPVTWKLTAKSDIKLETKCQFKVRASYVYSTDALSTVTFMSQAEFDRKMRQGQSTDRRGTLTLGSGPVKPYLEIEGRQPISTSDSAVVTLQIKNVGNGFITSSGDGKIVVKVDSFDFAGLKPSNECDIKAGDIEMIKKESSPKVCSLTANDKQSIEKTYNLKMKILYSYEFRKDIWVTINPKPA